MRLFAAALPPAEVLDHLALALGTVRGPGRGPLRWTEPGDRHLTLAFYGDVPEGYLAEVTGALDDVAGRTAPFRLALRGAGVFDGRTVWIGLAGDIALQNLMGAAASVGTEVLRRDPAQRSRAHVTVARVRGRRGGRGVSGTGTGAAHAAALAHALAVYEGPGWTVRDVVLMASDLGGGRGGAPRYDVVHRSHLAAVAG